MKRIGFKIGAITCGSVVLVLFAAWVATLPSDVERPQLAFGHGAPFAEMAVGKGRVIFCDSFGNREVMDLVDQSRWISPEVWRDQRLSLPGFSFRRITFTSGQPIWSLSFSLLIPCLLMAGPAGFFWSRFRTSSRTASVNQAAPRTIQTEGPRDDSDASALDLAA